MEISRIAKIYRVKPNTLEKQYKNNLSGFPEYEEAHEKKFREEAFVFPENFGENMSIDETGLINGNLYTLLVNKAAKGKRGSLAAIIKGTKANIITDAILDAVPLKKRLEIKEITLDLANNMDWIARQIVPQGLHTYDRFHVQQIVSDVVQAVRIKFRWEAIEEENTAILNARAQKQSYFALLFPNGDTKKQLLARSRYLLYKPSSKWNDQQKERAHILFIEFPLIKKAYDLSMYFRNCYEQTTGYMFENWIQKANESDIKEMKVAARTIESHLPGILNYFIHRSTNANIESFNAKLKLFRRNVRGVNNKNFFLFRLIKYFS